MIFAPLIEGALPLRSSSTAFIRAIRDRVASGLIGKNVPRSRYTIGESTDNVVRISAVDWQTAINVGLNELELGFSQHGRIDYQVRYWGWAAYATGLSGILGLIGLALLVGFDVRGYIATHPATRVRGFSIEQHLIIAWMMVLFWGFVWPWLLIALHKRPLHRLVARIVTEVDEQSGSKLVEDTPPLPGGVD
jgi:hypothetical protein